MHIQNKSKQNVLAQEVFLAKHFWARAKGLLGRKALFPQEALIIPQCQSIHMFFMQFPIDVVFVDRTYHVVGLVQRIKPFELSAFFWKASFAIELEAGTIEKTKTTLGDLLDCGSLDII
jgi:uncharacterized membrane protein (UPF0127 family)